MVHQFSYVAELQKRSCWNTFDSSTNNRLLGYLGITTSRLLELPAFAYSHQVEIPLSSTVANLKNLPAPTVTNQIICLQPYRSSELTFRFTVLRLLLPVRFINLHSLLPIRFTGLHSIAYQIHVSSLHCLSDSPVFTPLPIRFIDLHSITYQIHWSSLHYLSDSLIFTPLPIRFPDLHSIAYKIHRSSPTIACQILWSSPTLPIRFADLHPTLPVRFPDLHSPWLSDSPIFTQHCLSEAPASAHRRYPFPLLLARMEGLHVCPHILIFSFRYLYTLILVALPPFSNSEILEPVLWLLVTLVSLYDNSNFAIRLLRSQMKVVIF